MSYLGNTDWVLTPITGTWVTNTTYLCKTRRVGSYMEFRVKITLSGAPDVITLQLYMPSGLTLDVSQFVDGVNNVEDASGFINDVSPGILYAPLTMMISSTSIVPRCPSLSVHGAVVTMTNTVPITWASGDGIWLNFAVPIN